MLNQINKRTRNILIGFIMAMILGVAYIGSYVNFRNHHIEIWEQDNQTYVIFPKNNVIIYYMYRPLTYIDAKLTGMRFHIGSHREGEQ